MRRRGQSVVYLHPDRFAQVVKAHRERPLAVAAYLHGVAVHELTHLDGRMGKGHSEEFVAAREDLGHATGHLLPAIAVLVQRVLGLPAKPSEAERRATRLERDVKGLRAALRESRAVAARCGSGCRSCAAERMLEAALGALRASPPTGVEVGDVDGFAERNRSALLRLVEAGLAGRS